MLIALSSENAGDFIQAMSTAWRWTQRRKRFYGETGGAMGLGDYLGLAARPDRKQVAVLVAGRMVALITVHLRFAGTYEIHVTAPKGTSAGDVLDALCEVRGGLFNGLYAEEIATSCPVYASHEHKGSRRLAEACGMRPNGVEWIGRDPSVIWREYVLTREEYYGRTESNH